MRMLWVGLVALLVPAAPVLAQIDSRDAIALQNQILELRRDMQSLQQGGGRVAPPTRGDAGRGGDGSLTAQLLDRVSTLEDQVRELRGQVDRLGNQVQRQREEANKQIADLTFAMQNGGGGGAPATPPGRTPSAASPPPSSLGNLPASPPSTGPGPRTPEVAMQEGNAALARRDYPAAEAAAREVLGKRGPRATDAQFLLAQSEMGQRNYQQAAPDFYDAYNRAKTGARAPDALLGVANALIGLGDRQSACEALAKLRVEFPQPRSDLRDGEAAARQRASCR